MPFECYTRSQLEQYLLGTLQQSSCQHAIKKTEGYGNPASDAGIRTPR